MRIRLLENWQSQQITEIANSELSDEDKARRIISKLSELYQVKEPRVAFFREKYEPGTAAQYNRGFYKITFFRGAFFSEKFFIHCIFHEFAHHLQKVVQTLTGQILINDADNILQHEDRPHEKEANGFARHFESMISGRKSGPKSGKEIFFQTCPHCGHHWKKRVKTPKYRRCPKCLKYF